MSNETEAPSPVALAASGNCPNCTAPMFGEFCYGCGQPKRGLIRHLSGIVADFLDSVLSFDSRTFRTVLPLYFRPGFLTNEYFAGRRVRYVTPLRLYVFLSVITFLLIAWVAPIKTERGTVVDAPSVVDGSGVSADRTEKLAKIDDALKYLPAEEARKVRAEVLREMATEDAVAALALGPPDASQSALLKNADDGDGDVHIVFYDEEWHKTKNPLTFSWLSDDLNVALNEEIEELLEKGKRLTRDPKPFIDEVFSIAPQALFVILPLFALLLKVIYLFKRRLYMEHLIVALHSHSFISLSLLLLTGIYQLQDLTAKWPAIFQFWEILGILAGSWIPLYLLLMQKRVYRQGWIMTLLKFSVVGVAYIFLLTFGLLGTMLASLILL